MQILLSLIFISFSFAASADVPSAFAFKGWEDITEAGALRLDKIQKTEIKCGTKLYPAYPQSYLKLYHEILVGRYDHSRMTVHDEACAVAGFGPRRHCLRPKLIYSYTISDTFNDACGNLYRGYWKTVFFDSDETMGTLIAKGRTIYEDKKSDFPGSYISGATYASDLKDFVFLGAPLPGDVEKSREYRELALRKAFRFDEQTKTFEPVAGAR